MKGLTFYKILYSIQKQWILKSLKSVDGIVNNALQNITSNKIKMNFLIERIAQSLSVDKPKK